MGCMSFEEVRDCLETAAYVEKLMPGVHAPKYRSWLFDMVYTPQELAFMDRKPLKLRPTAEQIALWELVIMDWMPLLQPEDRKLVWKRANRIPWKLLCMEFGLSRQTLALRYEKALLKIRYGGKKMSFTY